MGFVGSRVARCHTDGEIDRSGTYRQQPLNPIFTIIAASQWLAGRGYRVG
jgi:hypothetical protein